MICSKCGEDKAKLFDIVSEEGIVSMCIDCLQDDEVPVVKKPIEGAFEDSNNKKSVYERLSSAAGINLEKHKKFEDVKNLQDSELKEIVNKNLHFGPANNLVEGDLVRNFHWIIMRARRLKKITLSELSRKIAEPEEVLKNIEKGIGGNFELINKLETYFGIYLLTEEARKKIHSVTDKKIGFDPVTTRSLTIDDLREMKKKKEAALQIGPEKSFSTLKSVSREKKDFSTRGKIFTDVTPPLAYSEKSSRKIFTRGKIFEEKEEEVKIEDYSKKEELSQEDIDDLIFGRKS